VPNVSYDLDEGTVRRQSANALARHSSTARFVALAVGAASPMSDVARTVESQVLGSDPATMASDYRRYEDDSLFVLVLDRRTGLPAAAGRVIDGGGRTLDDAPDHIEVPLSTIVAVHEMCTGRIWDLATIAVVPEYRVGRSAPAVGSLFYRTLLNAGRLAGVRHLVTMLDRRAHQSLLLLGMNLEPMAGSGPFGPGGSAATQALYASFGELEPSMARQSERLRRPGADFAGEITARGVRRLIIRRVAARVAFQVSSGTDLDEHILLPALDRRRLVRRR
jgi:hypothetical protein